MSIARNLSALSPNVSTAGVTQVAGGGTGVTAPGANGNVLTSNGTAFVSQPPAVNLALVFAIAAAL